MQRLKFDADRGRLRLAEWAGTVDLEGWDEAGIDLESTSDGPTVREVDDVLVLEGLHGDARLRVPRTLAVELQRHKGAVTVRGIRALKADRVDGDVDLEGIAEAVQIRDLTGDLRMLGAASLVLEDTRHDRARDHRERGARDVELQDVRTVDIQNVRKSLTIANAESVVVGNVGGTTRIEGVSKSLRISNVGGRFEATDISGDLHVDNVGGSATLSNVSAVRHVGNIGGSLTMSGAALLADHPLHIAIGGSAQIELPAVANLTLHATTGGHVHADGLGSSGMRHNATLVYGEGGPDWHLAVGGNLTVSGGGRPRSTQASWGFDNVFGSGSDKFKTKKMKFGPGDFNFDFSGIGEAFSGMGEAFSGAFAGFNTQTVAETRGANVATAEDTSAERVAILRMVAEGRITPEEGEQLLNALD